MRSVIASTVTFFLFAGISLFYPEIFLNPGQLSPQHEAIHNDCLGCHSIITGSVNKKCVSCHNVNDIDYKKTDGTILTSERKVKFHSMLQDNSCTECHSGHYPVNGKYTVSFSHELLAVNIIEKCSTCHSNVPDDKLHSVVKAECGKCHNTKGWDTDKFDHLLVSSAGLSGCVTCHQPDKPSDEIHSGLREECGTCHNTNKWSPADFAHEKYFVFDKDHPSDCKTCHVTSYKTYTCYSCHEHTESKIRNEHLEEGITDFGDCVSCHRSGDKHSSEHKSHDKEKDSDREDDDD